MKPQLGDFILTKCSAADFFDRSVYFEKMAQHSHVFNIGKAKCTICSETLDIERYLGYVPTPILETQK